MGLGGSILVQTSDSQSHASEPIVHQVPHVIDRSTGQPLLVNIQPSQVANVVIPQGGTQALIFGDTNEPHISGQYFDDPSPYPEPEGDSGLVGSENVIIFMMNTTLSLINRYDFNNFINFPGPIFNFERSGRLYDSTFTAH